MGTAQPPPFSSLTALRPAPRLCEQSVLGLAWRGWLLSATEHDLAIISGNVGTLRPATEPDRKSPHDLPTAGVLLCWGTCGFFIVPGRYTMSQSFRYPCR